MAARCGYCHVGLRPLAATPDETHFPILTDNALKRELLAVLDGEAIRVLDVEIIRIRPDMDWAQIESVCAFAQQLGATRMLVADNDPDPVRSKETLAKLSAVSAPYNVTPHLEFMPWTCAPNLTSALDRIAGIENCRLLIDAFHLVRSGGNPADITFREPQVGYVQLCDISGPIPAMDEILREARSDRLFPGDGEINLAQLLTTLPDIPISLEIPCDRLRDAGITAEARALRAITGTRALIERTGEFARL